MLTEQCMLTYERGDIKTEFTFFEDINIRELLEIFRAILLLHSYTASQVDEAIPVECDDGHEERTDS